MARKKKRPNARRRVSPRTTPPVRPRSLTLEGQAQIEERAARERARQLAEDELYRNRPPNMRDSEWLSLKDRERWDMVHGLPVFPKVVAQPTPVKARRKGKVSNEVLRRFFGNHKDSRSLSWPALARILKQEEGVELSHWQLHRRFDALPPGSPLN